MWGPFSLTEHVFLFILGSKIVFKGHVRRETRIPHLEFCDGVEKCHRFVTCIIHVVPIAICMNQGCEDNRKSNLTRVEPSVYDTIVQWYNSKILRPPEYASLCTSKLYNFRLAKIEMKTRSWLRDQGVCWLTRLATILVLPYESQKTNHFFPTPLRFEFMPPLWTPTPLDKVNYA